MITPPRVLFFDVNETLLDLRHVKTAIANVLNGNEQLVDVWFATLLHHSLVEMHTGQFHDFTEIGVAALQMVAHSQGIRLNQHDAKAAIAGPMTELPAHSDVPDALGRLRDDGYRLVALSNSSQKGLSAQLEHADLTPFFSAVLSVQQIKTYKPLKAVYRWACTECDVKLSDSMMIAAHGWDVCGAANAGMRTAFVARQGKMPYPLGPAPDMEVDNLSDFADRLSRES